jgi:ABC-2 type transport system permease protein
MSAALHAEWTKLRTVAGPAGLLLATIALTVALGALVAAATRCPAGTACGVDTVKLSLTGVQLSQAAVAILAVIVLSGEYSNGMIRVTLAAMPRRITLLAAKAAVITGLVLVAGSLGVGGSLLAGRLILPGHGFTAARGFPVLSLASGAVLRATAGSVLYLALIGLLALGTAAAVRDTAAAIGLVLGLLYLFPVLGGVLLSQDWQRHLEQIGPMTAGLAIQATTGLRGLPIGPWAGLGVLAAWAAGALAAGGLVLRLRDA